ncbi:hypothetical protein RD792_016252 [Penstemon davidsonii]|uniref:Alpha/beta hydrolase fold-3 domain-containing protein n=1 Tax=Penstemon davidsonii TaxID=160366 RepID=A0ABR0CJF5_9LAMI|nr:hypothetical protein RD792_016252 [Penstemon davidsonii]
MAVTSTELLHDFFPLIREYKDGRVERLAGNLFIPASTDPETGVQSKDIQIEPEINLSARLYLPEKPDPTQKLPILVYFHGGGFVVESAFSPLYHKHLNLLVAEANVLVVSVNYRLAPEHPLPIAYEDSWLALKWVHQNKEEWIGKHADLDRVYLGGDSPGGNIAHNIAMRAGKEKLQGIKLCGVVLNCPFFWGKDVIGNEAKHAVFSKSYLDKLWLYACPGAVGCDDPRINPGMDPDLSSIGCKRVLVYVAEKDVFRERGLYFEEALKKSGWGGEVEVVDVEGEDHIFSVFSPCGESGMAMLKKVADFLNWEVPVIVADILQLRGFTSTRSRDEP